MEKMMGGSPSWWSMNSHRPSAGLSPARSSSFSSSGFHQYHQPSTFQAPSSWLDSQEIPFSWSQLLLGSVMQEEDRYSFSTTAYNPPRKMEEWKEDDDRQIAYTTMSPDHHTVDLNKGIFGLGAYPALGHGDEQISHRARVSSGSCMMISASSSIMSSGMLDFSASYKNHEMVHDQQQDRPSEVRETVDYRAGGKVKCNGTSTGSSALKKAKLQVSSALSSLKVRKEKVGDRITTLHQLVSPFGKTDTASVLLEAIGYIRFLQSQIQALSSPYLSTARNKQWHPNGREEPIRDLRNSGLCLVPMAFILHFGGENSNGADYWSPTFGGIYR